MRKHEIIDTWLDLLPCPPTKKEIRKFQALHEISRVYMDDRVSKYYCRKEAEREVQYSQLKMAQSKVFESEIENFNYNIEHDIRNVDVDTLYHGYKSDLVIIQKLR